MDRAEEGGQIGLCAGLAGRQVLAVGLYGLPKQRHLPHALGAVRSHLSADIAYRARALPSAPIRNDAVGAELIAAVDYRHERRRPLRVRERIRPELAAQIRFGHHVPEDDLEALRARPDVDVREAGAQVVGPRPDHAAHHRDLEPALARFLELPQQPKVARRTVFGLLPHDAGIHDGKIRFAGLLGRFPAQLREARRQLLRVRLVHLAALSPDVVPHDHSILAGRLIPDRRPI